MKKLLRIIKKHGFQIPYHHQDVWSNLEAAADYLSAKELTQMIRDYGY